MSDDLPAQACVVFLCVLSVCPSLASCVSFDVLVHFRAVDATRGDAVSYLERLELVLRLAHVGLEEGERAELLDPVARVPIYRIVPFMDLDAA